MVSDLCARQSIGFAMGVYDADEGRGSNAQLAPEVQVMGSDALETRRHATAPIIERLWTCGTLAGMALSTGCYFLRARMARVTASVEIGSQRGLIKASLDR